MQRKTIARIKVISEIRLIDPLRNFVREVALQEGFKQRDAERLMLATEEAAVNVIEHALGSETNSWYEMILEKEPGRFILAFEDQGTPLEWDTVGKGEQAGLGILLIRHCADRINFLNLGKRGKRFEIIKEYVSESADNTEIETEDRCQGELPDIAPLDTPLEIREMTAGDCSALARCMYQVYGYTYKDAVYYPEKIAELLSRGLLVSMIALNPEGEVVGHQGLLKPRLDAMTAEITMGIVHPRYRGRRLFERLKEKAFARMQEVGLLGLFGELVTNHPYSQKANYALGVKPSGFMLGFVPADRVFLKMSEEQTDPERMTVVLVHARLNAASPRLTYPPVHHQSIIKRTYEECGIPRSAGEGFLDGMDGIRSSVSMRTVPESGVAFLDAITIGEDFHRVIKGMLRELRLLRFDCIYIDLPLANPATALVCAVVESLGFFYAGIIPDYLPTGDALRLQYLNNVAITPEKVVVVSDFGTMLFNYIVAEWQRCL